MPHALCLGLVHKCDMVWPRSRSSPGATWPNLGAMLPMFKLGLDATWPKSKLNLCNT
jgi:hypothetical protein